MSLFCIDASNLSTGLGLASSTIARQLRDPARRERRRGGVDLALEGTKNDVHRRAR